MRLVFPLLCGLLIAATTACAGERALVSNYRTAQDMAVEARIQRIEVGLLPGSLIAGQPVEGMALRDRMTHYGTPGVSIAVINNYQIEWAESYGVRKLGTEELVTNDTVFQAASISKPVTAVATLRLVKAGRISLDADVNNWLTTWRVPENDFTRSAKVTLRGIMTHTAGFRIMAYPGTPTNQPMPSTLDLLEGPSRRSRWPNPCYLPARDVIRVLWGWVCRPPTAVRRCGGLTISRSA